MANESKINTVNIIERTLVFVATVVIIAVLGVATEGFRKISEMERMEDRIVTLETLTQNLSIDDGRFGIVVDTITIRDEENYLVEQIAKFQKKLDELRKKKEK